MLQEVDDMPTWVLKGPPLSLTQYASIMSKVQTIICRCMVSIGGTLDYIPSQHYIQQIFVLQPLRHCPQEPVLEHSAHGVKRGDRQLPGGRDRVDPGHGGESGGGSGGRRYGDPGSYVPPDPFDNPDLDASSFSLGLTSFAPSHPSGTGTLYVPPDPFDSSDIDYIQPPPSKGGMSYAPLPPSVVELSFDAPPSPSTTVSTDEDHSNIRQHVIAITQMVFDEPSMLYLVIEEYDEDDDDADEDCDTSNASDNNNNPNDEEDDISTPVNPLSSIQ
ncbi:hypothetical protein M9H77_27168 [Catharanthus roseus]|uniref:Uncharacterized protein n=1 Tax=Catharanthus roseus TaxID=4058 RepID=A0ACC0ABX3_CATRO|nr:hypothetical protein M9H77_27168 [Catharanthus roseus]